MKKVIDVLRWICTIILAVGIIIFGFASIVSSTILNKRYVLGKFEETDYYINTFSQVNVDFENYVLQSGLNKSVVENLVTVDNIKEDTEKIIENIYDGQSEPIDLEKIKNRLRTNIEKNIEEKNIWVRSQASIDKYVDVVSSQYNDSILHLKYEEQLYNGVQSIRNAISKITTISITMIGIPMIFLLVSRYKKFWQNFTMIGISLVTAGAFYIFANVFMKMSVDIEHIIIFNEALSYSLRTTIFDILSRVNLGGIIMLPLGFMLVVVGNFIRSSKHSHSRHR